VESSDSLSYRTDLNLRGKNRKIEPTSNHIKSHRGNRDMLSTRDMMWLNYLENQAIVPKTWSESSDLRLDAKTIFAKNGEFYHKSTTLSQENPTF
jgi:hypothetical protein